MSANRLAAEEVYNCPAALPLFALLLLRHLLKPQGSWPEKSNGRTDITATHLAISFGAFKRSGREHPGSPAICDVSDLNRRWTKDVL